MWNIFTKEIIYYFKNIKELIVISFLFVSITLLVPFSFRADSGVPDGVGVTILWLALVAAVQLGASHSWLRHSEAGELESFQLLPWLLESTVIGKVLAFYAVMLVQLLLLVPLASLWLGIATEHWPVLAAGLAVGALALVVVNQLAAGLMAGTRKGAVTIGAVTLPFSVPILIFGTSYCRQPALIHENLLFLAAYAIFLLPITALAVAANIRASH